MSVNIKTDDGKVSIASGSGSGAGGQTIQVVGLPTPTAENLNKVYQYVGLSTETYVFGHFYQCIEDSENPGTYIWATVYVQPTSTEEDMDLSNYVTKKEMNNHVENGTLHCTAGEKITWNSKADGSYESKNIDIVSNTYTGTNKVLVDSKYLYNQLKSAVSNYTELTDFNKHIGNNNTDEKHMTNAQQEIVSKLGTNAEGQLTFNDGAVASDVAISAVAGNIIENKPDGLYAAVDDYAKSADVASTYLSQADAASTYATQASVTSAIADVHTHANKTSVLDKLDVDATSGKLTFDGSLVSNATVNISADADNIIEERADGLYVAETDLSAYAKTSDLDDYEKTADLTTTLADYAKTTDLADYAKTADLSSYATTTSVADAIAKAHDHDNKTYLDLIGQDADGKLLYNGAPVGTTVVTPTGDIKWSDVTGKPFVSLDSTTLAVTDEGALKVIGGGGGGGGTAQIDPDPTNSIVLRTNGIYSPKVDLTPYEKTADLNTTLADYQKTADAYDPTNKDTLNKLGVNDSGQLTLDGAVVANASVTLDPATDNQIKNNENGLYVAPVPLDDYAKTADVSSTYLTQTDASSTYATQTSVADAITNEHSHTNKTDVLDKLSTNTDGDLLFNGVAINADATGIATHMADTTIHTDATEKAAWNAKYDKPATGIPASDLASAVTTDINSRMKTTDWVNTTKNKIFGNKIDVTQISHTQLKDIGSYSHDELEVLLENHISNTSLHNSASLNTITISNTGWSDGTMLHCHLNDENDLCLDTVIGPDGKEYYYTTEKAKFTSMVYNSGIDDNSWVNINWFGTYSIYHTDVVVKVRVGSTNVPDEETWTNWTDVTLTKSLSGMVGRYIQVQLEFTTDDDTRDVVFKNIQMSYGVDVFDEVSASRERAQDGVTYATLKLRLDQMDTDAKTTTDEVIAARTKGDAETGTTYASLDARLEAMDTANDEVIAAHVKTVDSVDTNYTSLKARLDASDKAIADLDAAIPAADIQTAINETIAEWAADFATT